MDGVINVYKPKGITSFDVIYKVRKALNTKRVGHTGTLDPMADGVLPVCVGKATKASELIMASEKTYRAEITFGSQTDTQDSTGVIVNSTEKRIEYSEFLDAVNCFLGDIQQIPPMYSAVHHDGQRLYQLARRGILVKREPRTITVKNIKVEDFSKETATITVSCSKGTYIRTLCEDIGIKAGCMAHMSSLTRTKSGLFCIEDSIRIEDIKEELLTPVDKLFTEYEKITLSEGNEKKVTNGMALKIDCEEGKLYRLYGEKGNFLCISEGIENGTILKMKKSFY